MRILCFILSLILPLSTFAQSEKIAGWVSHIQGAALVNHANTSEHLRKYKRILAGDQIITGKNSRVQLKMIDDTVLTLGENTKFIVRDYAYSEQKQTGQAALELVKGVFRAITGAIGKLKGQDFKVHTQSATIGIRGTDFWGGYHFSDALDVALLDGKGIYIENEAGRVEISRTGQGTTVTDQHTAPSQPKPWGTPKLEAAQASVALTHTP